MPSRLMALGLVLCSATPLGFAIPYGFLSTQSPGNAPGQDREEGSISFEEKCLTVLPQELRFKGEIPIVRFTPDGRSAACVGTAGTEEQLVVVGANRGDGYDKVWPLIYSPEVHEFAYAAEMADGACLVVGGKKSEKVDQISWVDRDPGGRSVVYSARKGQKWFVVSGNKRGEEFDEIGLDRARVGNHLVYTGKINGKWVVVVGDKKGEEFDSVECLTTDPEDTIVSYAASSEGRSFIVLDGKKIPQLERTRSIVLGPQGKSLAYTTQKDGKAFVVFQTAKGEDFDEVSQITLNAEGTAVAYAARKGSKWFAVVGDRRSEAFAIVIYPTFPPDGKTLSYIAADEVTRQFFIVLGDKRGEEVPFIMLSTIQAEPSWSSMHRRLRLTLSPDGKAAAYVSVEPGGKWRLIAGTSKSEPFDLVSEAFFSPDGRKVAFGALKGRELWWKVIEVK